MALVEKVPDYLRKKFEGAYDNNNVPFEGRNSAHPFKFASWDIEAENWYDLTYVGYTVDGEKYIEFTDLCDFLEHILVPINHGVRFFSHFGGRYDTQFVYDLLKDNQTIKMDFYNSGSACISLVVYFNTHRSRKHWKYVKFCDSFRLTYCSLEKLLKSFGTKYQKLPFDPESYEYRRNDVLGLYEALEKFFAITGDTSETLASLSMKVYRNQWLHGKVKPISTLIEKIIRLSYHGGRVEVFKKKGNVRSYDVNSMYPYCMSQNVPTDYIGRSPTINIDPNLCGFYACVVNVPEMYVPPLPKWAMGKLLFPCGEVTGVYTDLELRLALEQGCEVKIFDGWLFKGEPILKDYSEFCFAHKSSSPEPLRTIWKLMINALYGKFGQQRFKKAFGKGNFADKKDAIPICDIHTGEDLNIYYYYTFSFAPYILPHIASYITSRARVHLYQQLIANDPQASLYYCDTDSVFLGKNADIVLTSDALGQWSWQGEGSATFYQPKLYEFAGKWKAKGLDRYDNLLYEAFAEGRLCLTGERAKSIKEAIRDNEASCQRVPVRKTMLDSFPKRLWTGKDTRPYFIKEGLLL